MWRSKNESGSAPIEFVLLVLPVMAVTFLTWNLIVGSYLKLVMTDSVIEGARTAALADQSLVDGKSRVFDLVTRATMGLAKPIVVANSYLDSFGNRVVSISANLQGPMRIEVTSIAMAEIQN